MFQKLLRGQEGGVKGAIWTIGLIIVIVAIALLLYIFAPDLVCQILYILADFILGSFNI